MCPVDPPDTPAAASTAPAFPLFLPDDLERFIPGRQWSVYADVMRCADRSGACFAVGGGIANCLYTGRWRPHKDIDLYVDATQRDALIEATHRSGLRDYYDTQAYDRSWIYRASDGEVIVDVIWALANGFGAVEPGWLDGGPRVELDGFAFPLLAPVEMIWTKLHVMQRDRCDWPDLLGLLYAAGPAIDWQRLIAGLRCDDPLLAALLTVFAWLAPGRAAQLPGFVWRRLGLLPPAAVASVDEARINRLDTRPWFTPARLD